MSGEEITRLVVFVAAIGITGIIFYRLRKRALAVRGLYSLGFMGLFAVIVSANQPSRLNDLLIAAAIPFGIIAVVEVWEGKKAAKQAGSQEPPQVQSQCEERRE